MKGNALTAVIAGVLVISTAFIGIGVLDSVGLDMTSTNYVVETQSDWEDGTIGAGLTADNGTLRFADGASETTSTYTSPEQNADNLTQLTVGLGNITDGNVTATVTAYDSGGTTLNSVTQVVSDDNTANLTSLQDSNADTYDVELELQRATTSDQVEVDSYKVLSEDTATSGSLATLAALGLLVLGLAAVVRRRF